MLSHPSGTPVNIFSGPKKPTFNIFCGAQNQAKKRRHAAPKSQKIEKMDRQKNPEVNLSSSDFPAVLAKLTSRRNGLHWHGFGGIQL